MLLQVFVMSPKEIYIEKKTKLYVHALLSYSQFSIATNQKIHRNRQLALKDNSLCSNVMNATDSRHQLS
jgi:hypothetical protein